MRNMSDLTLLLNETFPGRKDQIAQLCRLFPENCARLSPYILLEGLPGSGRTAIIQKIMEIRKCCYILVDCIECHSPRLLHFRLLYGLYGEFEEAYEEVNSLASVYNYFQKIEDKKKLRCIILKNSHQLSQSVLEQLCAFQKKLLQNEWNFTLVFISECSEHINNLNIHFVRILFPLYDKDQLIEILMKDQDENSVEIFRNFLDLFLPMAMPIFRDLSNLKRLTHKFFPIYRKPIDDGTMTANEVVKIGKVTMQYLKMNDYSVMYSYPDETINKEMLHVMDLPLGTKYLLLAAFLASFVPQNKDRIFSQISSKKKKRNVKLPSKKDIEANNIALTGPKSFKFSRLIFIYTAVLGDKAILNVNLISQVAALIELGLITSQGDSECENMSEPTYKCIANSSCVYAIAKNTNFEIEKYLKF